MPRIRLLTGGDLELDGTLAVGPIGRMPRALLVMLLLEHNRPVPRDVLAARLWPDADQPTARHRLRMTLYSLRQALAETLLERLSGDGETLCLDVPRDWVDVHLFEDAIGKDVGLSVEAGESLYRGALVAGFPPVSDEFDAYLGARRDALANAALAAVHRDLSSISDSDDQRIFDERFRRALALDPGNERSYLLAMEYWARAGSPPDVARTLAEARTAARREYDADISDELEATAKRLAAQAETNGRHRPSPEPEPDPQVRGATAGGARQVWVRLTGALVILSIVFAGLYFAAWPYLWPRASVPVIRLGQEAEGSATCSDSDLVDLFESGLLKAVGQLGGATFVMGTAPDPVGDDLVLQHSVVCLTGTARASVTLTDAGTGTVLWIGRYIIDREATVAFEGRLQSDLQSEIRRFAEALGN